MSTNSLRKLIPYITLMTVSIVGGFGLMIVIDQLSPPRGIASVYHDERWQTPVLGKHLAPLRVHINLPAILPERDDEELVVTGYVNLSQEASSEIQYKWTLPEGTSIVLGQVSGELNGARPGQTIPIKISLVGFSKEQRKVLVLEAAAQVGKHSMGNSTVVSSRPEDSMEFIAIEKMKSREEFDKAASATIEK